MFLCLLSILNIIVTSASEYNDNYKIDISRFASNHKMIDGNVVFL